MATSGSRSHIVSEVGLWSARVSLLTLVTLLPWSFGGVDAFSQYLMCPLLLWALLCGGLAELITPIRRAAIPWLFTLGCLFLGIGCMQSVDLGSGVVATLSPRVSQLRNELTPEPQALVAPPKSPQLPSTPNSLSVYPAATRRETAILLCGFSVLIMATRWFRSRAALSALTTTMVVNGAALAYFGLVQRLSWNGQLYWSIPVEVQTPFGPFVNRNTGGGFLVICLGALLPLLHRRLTTGWWRDELESRSRMAFSTRSISFSSLANLAAACLILCGLVVSLSRGAWLGAMLGLTAWLIWTGRPAWHSRTLTVLVAGAIAATSLLSWLSLTDQVGGRVSESLELEVQFGGRAELWGDIMTMIPDFWCAGSGLGTFGLVQPIYQTRPMTVWYDQAENLFLQALIEGGLCGLLLMLYLAFQILREYRALSRGADDLIDRGYSGMGVYLIVSQIVCASFDFGLRYPANQFALALLAGAVLGLAAAAGRDSQADSRDKNSLFQRLLSLLTVSAMFLGVLASWHELAWSGGVELVLNRGETERDAREISRVEREEEMSALKLLLDVRPDNAEGHARLAELYVLQYRQAAYETLQAEFGSTSELNDAELWDLTSTMVLHRQSAEFVRTQQSDLLQELRDQPLVQASLVPAVNSIMQARRYGPFLYRPHQLLAQLAFLTDDPLQDQAEVDRTVRLLPQNPDIRYWAGLLDWQGDRVPAAIEQWRDCLRLSSRYDQVIIDAVMPELPADTIVSDLLPDDITAMIRLVDAARQNPDFAKLGPRFGVRLVELAERPAAASGDSSLMAYARGIGYELQGNLTAATAELRAAVALDSSRLEWRLTLAELLAARGELTDAIREIQVVVRLQPQNISAKVRLDQLIEESLNSRSRARQVAPEDIPE